MAKLKTDPISSTDLLDYLSSYSDFSFELSVLKMLRESGIDCDHGGHYQDPVTNKSREFDIRAIKTILNFRVRMAIECKNIRENFPILISCIPRHDQESYHQIVLSKPSNKSEIDPFAYMRPRVLVLSICGDDSLYKPGEPVGKSTVQVGRNLENTISTNDSEIYEKWGQCLNSATNLVERTYWDGNDDDDIENSNSAVIPFVVVPNGRLWMATYDDEGNMTSNPTTTDRCPCFIAKSYKMGTKDTSTRMYLSHVEIVTFNGMRNFINNYLKTEEGMAKIFSEKGKQSARNHMRELIRRKF